MFRYSPLTPITRYNNAHYPLQHVIRDKSWKKKEGENKKKKESVPKNKI
jgi:hypothetical protein